MRRTETPPIESKGLEAEEAEEVKEIMTETSSFSATQQSPGKQSDKYILYALFSGKKLDAGTVKMEVNFGIILLGCESSYHFLTGHLRGVSYTLSASSVEWRVCCLTQSCYED